MELAEIVAITGMSGLFKVTSRRNDGLIVTSLVDDKTQFVSGRTHLFSTLDNITLYTTDEPALLKDVLASIKGKEASHPTPDGKDDSKLKAWMEAVLPTYDKEKVYASDIKKLAKWYSILNAKGLIEELTADKPEPTKATAAEGEEEKKAKPAKEDKAKKEAKPKVKKEVAVKAQPKTAAPVKKITTPRKAS